MYVGVAQGMTQKKAMKGFCVGYLKILKMSGRTSRSGKEGWNTAAVLCFGRRKKWKENTILKVVVNQEEIVLWNYYEIREKGWSAYKSIPFPGLLVPEKEGQEYRRS